LPLVHPWTWQFSKLLHNVTATAFAAKVPQYNKVLELDRKIRDFPVPFRMQDKCGQKVLDSPRPEHMQRYFCMASKEISQCYPFHNYIPKLDRIFAT
jgi:hypothetical protein